MLCYHVFKETVATLFFKTKNKVLMTFQHIADVAAASPSSSKREASEEREIELTNRYHLVIKEGVSREDAVKGCDSEHLEK